VGRRRRAADAVRARGRGGGAGGGNAIRQFDATILVGKDGAIDVTEAITVHFSGAWNGLYRTIPVEYHTPQGFNWTLRLDFLGADEKRLASQIQGRTYANMFGLVERFIGPKILEVSRDHWLGDQTAFEALVRFTDEEIKHQELFRRVEALIAEGMPDGYTFLPDPNAVANAVLSKSGWAVLALTCHIEIFVLAHYRESIDPDPDLSELFKDVFLFHWREEAQHATLDELEWRREHQRLSPAQRDMQAWVRQLFTWRKANPVLHDGALMQYAPLDGVYVFFRYDAQRTVMVVMNKNEQPRDLSLARFAERVAPGDAARDIFSGRETTLGDTLHVPARGPVVLEIRRR